MNLRILYCMCLRGPKQTCLQEGVWRGTAGAVYIDMVVRCNFGIHFGLTLMALNAIPSRKNNFSDFS